MNEQDPQTGVELPWTPGHCLNGKYDTQEIGGVPGRYDHGRWAERLWFPAPADYRTHAKVRAGTSYAIHRYAAGDEVWLELNPADRGPDSPYESGQNANLEADEWKHGSYPPGEDAPDADLTPNPALVALEDALARIEARIKIAERKQAAIERGRAMEANRIVGFIKAAVKMEVQSKLADLRKVLDFLPNDQGSNEQADDPDE